MQSDILILFASPQSDADISRAKHCLMDTDRSVLVHCKEGSKRLLLVSYSPASVSPAVLLHAVHDAGFKATMAGG